MKLLLDTHLLLWAGTTASGSSGKLPSEAEVLILDDRNELFFSPVSVWEVAIKNGLGRPDFRVDPHLFRRALLDGGYIELPITSAHTAAVANLPNHHKDPFDRLLVAQSTVEGISLLSNDAALCAYIGSPVRYVSG